MKSLKKLLALVLVSSVLVFIAGCVTSQQQPFENPPGSGNWETNEVTIVDPRLGDTLEKLQKIVNVAIPPESPYSVPANGILSGISALLIGISGVLAKKNNDKAKALKTIVAGVEKATSPTASSAVAVKAAISEVAETMGTAKVTKAEVTKAKG